ncbi:RNA polymerase sigma factor [Streptomyces sp. NPDC003011]
MTQESERPPVPDGEVPGEHNASDQGDTADDGALLARSARDPAAFEALVGRHAMALHGYLVRRAPAAADDLLSEVWLQAYASRRTFDSARGTVRTWLFGVARNVLAGHWRHAVREQPDPEPERSGRGPAGTDPWHAVDQRLDAAALAPLVRRTLAGLPPVERELMLLVAWEQLTPTEAAAVLGIPPGTARSRLHRARNRLREALDPGLPQNTRTAPPPSPSSPSPPSPPSPSRVLRSTGDLA